MTAIPDQFDLWIRKARIANAERQLDYVLGSMFALSEWFFLNQGNAEKPSPAIVDLEKERHLLVFSSESKMDDFFGERAKEKEESIPFFAIKTAQVVDYCLEFRAVKCAGILVNPGDYSFAVNFEILENFHQQWKSRDLRASRGFWIPNMTTEEEDFWQEHGVD